MGQSAAEVQANSRLSACGTQSVVVIWLYKFYKFYNPNTSTFSTAVLHPPLMCTGVILNCLPYCLLFLHFYLIYFYTWVRQPADRKSQHEVDLANLPICLKPNNLSKAQQIVLDQMGMMLQSLLMMFLLKDNMKHVINVKTNVPVLSSWTFEARRTTSLSPCFLSCFLFYFLLFYKV